MHRWQNSGGSTRETEAKSMAETKDVGIFEMCSLLRALDKHMAETAHPPPNYFLASVLTNKHYMKSKAFSWEKGKTDYKKHRNVLEILLAATYSKHQHCAGSWDTNMNGVQPCFSEAILIMKEFHPQVSTFMLSVLTPTATNPGLVLSLVWVTEKASGILFPSFTSQH